MNPPDVCRRPSARNQDRSPCNNVAHVLDRIITFCEYTGRVSRIMLSGTSSRAALCQPAPEPQPAIGVAMPFEVLLSRGSISSVLFRALQHNSRCPRAQGSDWEMSRRALVDGNLRA